MIWLRWLSRALLGIAFLCVAILLVHDARSGLRMTVAHHEFGAWSFLAVGAAYLLVLGQSMRSERIQWREWSLGIAYLLWGSEQFLSPSPWATVVDTLVVLVFVIDLGVVTLVGLTKRPKSEGE